MSRRLLLAVIVFLIASRVPFWTEYPPNFDFVNFALGVERFAPADHQPHPPGYPLVVLLGKLLAAAGIPTVRALYLAALAGSVAAVIGAWRWGGLLAAALLAIEPAFWFSGVSSPARPFLAAGVCWVLYGCWRLSHGEDRWLWITALLLAVFGGFRPELLLLLAIPCLLAAQWGGVSWSRAGAAAAGCVAACLPWMMWLVASFSTPRELLRNYYYYYLHHASTTSALLGAPRGAWQGMLGNALLWNALPAAIAVAGLLWGRDRFDRRLLALAGAYFVPAILVQLFIHQGADSPDHSLGTIVVLLVTGAALLRGRAMAIAGAVAVAMLAVSAGTLRSQDRMQRTTASYLQELRRALETGDAVLVLNDSPVSARLLEWEFPRNVVLSLDSEIGKGTASGWRFYQRRQTPLSPAPVILRAVARLHVLGNPPGAQRGLVYERLCSPMRCNDHGWQLEVIRGEWQGPLELPPYKLQVGGP